MGYGYLSVPYEPAGYYTDPFTGQQWEDWRPAFALKDGLVLTDDNSKKYKIKAEFVEKRMKLLAAESCSALKLPEFSELVLPERVADMFATDSDADAGDAYGPMPKPL